MTRGRLWLIFVNVRALCTVERIKSVPDTCSHLAAQLLEFEDIPPFSPYSQKNLQV